MLRAWSLLHGLLKYQNFLSYTQIEDEGTSDSAHPKSGVPTTAQGQPTTRENLYTNVVLNIGSYQVRIPSIYLTLDHNAFGIIADSTITITSKSESRAPNDRLKSSSYLRRRGDEIKSLILLIFFSGLASFIRWFVNYKRQRQMEDTTYRLEIRTPNISFRENDSLEDRLSIQNLPMCEISLVNFAKLSVLLLDDLIEKSTLLSIQKFGLVELRNFENLSVSANLATQSLEIISTASLNLSLTSENAKQVESEAVFLTSSPTGASTVMDEVTTTQGAEAEEEETTSRADVATSWMHKYLGLIIRTIFGPLPLDYFESGGSRNSCCHRDDLFFGFRSFRLLFGLDIDYNDTMGLKFERFDLGVSRYQTACLLEDIEIRIPDGGTALAHMCFTRNGDDRLINLENWRCFKSSSVCAHTQIPQLTIHLLKDSGNMALSEKCEICLRSLTEMLEKVTADSGRIATSESPPSDNFGSYFEKAKHCLRAIQWTMSIAEAKIQITDLKSLLPMADKSTLPESLAIELREVTMMVRPDSFKILCVAVELLRIHSDRYINLIMRSASLSSLAEEKFDFFEETFLSFRTRGNSELQIHHDLLKLLILENPTGSRQPVDPAVLRMNLVDVAFLSKDWLEDSIIVGSSLKIASGEVDYEFGEPGRQTSEKLLIFQNLQREPLCKTITVDRTLVCLNFLKIHRYLSEVGRMFATTAIKSPIIFPLSSLFNSAQQSHNVDDQFRENITLDAQAIRIRRSAILQFLRIYEEEDTLVSLIPNTGPRRLESIYADLWFRLSLLEGAISLMPRDQESSSPLRVLQFLWTTHAWIDFDLTGVITYLEANMNLNILKEVKGKCEPTKIPSAFLVKEHFDEAELKMVDLTGLNLADREMQSFLISKSEACVRLGFTQSVTVIQTIQPLNLHLSLANEDLALISKVCENVMTCLADYTNLMSYCIDQSGSFTLRLDIALQIESTDSYNRSLKIQTDEPVQFIYRDTSVTKSRLKRLSSDTRIGLCQPGLLKISLDDGSKAIISIQSSEINISLTSQTSLPDALKVIGSTNKRERADSEGDRSSDFNQLSIFAKSATMHCADEKSFADFYHQYNDLLSFWYSPNRKPPFPNPMRLTIDLPVRKLGEMHQRIERLPYHQAHRLWEGDSQFIRLREINTTSKNTSSYITLWNKTSHTFMNPLSSCVIRPNESLILPQYGLVTFESSQDAPSKMSFRIRTSIMANALNSIDLGSCADDFRESENVRLDYQVYRDISTDLLHRVFVIQSLKDSPEEIDHRFEQITKTPAVIQPRRSSRASIVTAADLTSGESESLTNNHHLRRCHSDRGPSSLCTARTILRAQNLVRSGIVSIQTLTTFELTATCTITSEDQTFEVEGEVRKLFLAIPKTNSYSPFSALPLEENVEVEIPVKAQSSTDLVKLPWPPDQIVLTYGNGLDIAIYARSVQGKMEIFLYPGTLIRASNIDRGPLRICVDGGKTHQNLEANGKICLFRPLRYCVIKNSEDAAADIAEYTAPLTEDNGMVIFSSCVFPFGDDESTPMFVKERLLSWSRDPNRPHEMIFKERPLNHRPCPTNEATSVVYNNCSIPLCLLSGLGGKFIAPYGGWCYMNLKDTYLLASVKSRPPYLPSFICIGSLPGATTEGYTTPSYTIAPKQSPQYQPFVSYTETYNLLAPVPANLAALFSTKLSSPVTAESIKSSLILSQQRINIQLVYRNSESIHMIISPHIKHIEEEHTRRMRCRLHAGDLKITLKDLKLILREPNILVGPASDGNSVTMQWYADSGLYWKEKPLLCLPVTPSNSRNSFTTDDSPWLEPPGQCNLTFVLQSTIYPSRVSETVLKGITIGLEDSVMRAVIDPTEFAEFTALCNRLANDCKYSPESEDAESQILIENLVVTETTVEALADKFISIRTFTTLPQYEFSGCAKLFDAMSNVWNAHVLQHIKQSWPSILLNTRVGSTNRPMPNRLNNVP